MREKKNYFRVFSNDSIASLCIEFEIMPYWYQFLFGMSQKHCMLARAIARKVSFVKFEYDAFDTHFHKHFQPKHLISNQANAWLSRFAMILSSILNSKSSTNVTRCWSVRIGCAALHCIALCCAVRSLCAHTIININNILHTKFYSRISPIVCFCLLSTTNNNKAKRITCNFYWKIFFATICRNSKQSAVIRFDLFWLFLLWQ